jgi:endonuclease-3
MPSPNLMRLLRKKTFLNTEDFVVSFAIEKFGKNPFLTILGIVLSQNTSDKNALKALKCLIDKGIMNPRSFREAGEENVLECLKKAGLYRQRYATVKNILEKLDTDPMFLDRVCSLNEREARKLLMKIKGIGRKTADVFLSAYCGKNVFPVDRHILRITARVLGKEKISYEEASEYWRKIFKPEEYGEAHRRLIDLGRRYCHPRHPDCGNCPLKKICRTARMMGATK